MKRVNMSKNENQGFWTFFVERKHKTTEMFIQNRKQLRFGTRKFRTGFRSNLLSLKHLKTLFDNNFEVYCCKELQKKWQEVKSDYDPLDQMKWPPTGRWEVKAFVKKWKAVNYTSLYNVGNQLKITYVDKPIFKKARKK